MPIVNNSDDVKVNKTQVTVFLTTGLMSHSRDKHSWVWFLSFQSFSSWQNHVHTAPRPDILSLCMCVSATQQGAAEGVSFLPSCHHDPFHNGTDDLLPSLHRAPRSPHGSTISSVMHLLKDTLIFPSFCYISFK